MRRKEWKLRREGRSHSLFELNMPFLRRKMRPTFSTHPKKDLMDPTLLQMSHGQNIIFPLIVRIYYLLYFWCLDHK